MQYSFRIMISTHEIKNNIDFTTKKKIKMKKHPFNYKLFDGYFC